MKSWKKISILMCLAVLLCMPGCSSVTGSSADSLDIDYVGEDGEITEEEVTADSGSMMDWLKNKLSADKKEAGKAAGRDDVMPDNGEQSGLAARYGLEGTDQESSGNGEAESQNQEVSDQQPASDPMMNIPAQDKTSGTVDIPIPDPDGSQSTEQKKPEAAVKKNTVTFTIRCDTAVANGMHKEAKWAGIVPASGCILPVITMEFEEGETVFDLLCRVRDTYKLQMEYSGTNGGEYIEGINNLYEFDGGRWSGWMYCVNGWYPNYGCGQYTVKNGDVIEWNYTCDLGLDLDGGWWDGAQEWKDTHD